ncbi:phospholipid-transporting ATPase 1 [Cristinia sonorae]|uniref:Phospholipid-transporting ATPase n=1 Tax=Cristinia sonorae TaxID=1940300 RepID=A0A8K0UIL3_9AGAR|nr:phospholipid-transporting ATPase 1 [Cristinia sonorae]
MSFFRRHPDPDTLDDDENDGIDPELRLRTTRTAHSTIAESIRTEQRAERRKTMKKKRSFFRNRSTKDSERKKRPSTAKSEDVVEAAAPPSITGLRRNIYVNRPLAEDEVVDGEPITRYVRNKVRTSKYTVLTFIPKNLYEQFRRVANLYFLVLIILQMFPMFGAASPQTAALPLLFILTVTAIKDGVEDYRRAVLDDEVNNSASTKLGNWKNVNQPTDPRNWLERLLGLNPPGTVTKGVRKLRGQEASEGKRIVLAKSGEDGRQSVSVQDSLDSPVGYDGAYYSGAGGRRLEDIQSVDEHSYPPMDPKASMTSINMSNWHGGSGTLAAYQQSLQSRSSVGVIDYRRRTSGMARWERTLWKKLEVGDIVLLRDNEQVPADIVVLATSDPDNLCYLETKNLDGETNLKPRKSVRATSSIMSEEDIERISFVLDSEPPHQNLYLYNGVLRYTDPATGESKQESVTINELLLRGCTVRNTPWIIGLVAFTGADTKIMLNGGETPSKRSKIEKETNFNVMVNFVVLLCMCIISAIANGVLDSLQDTSAQFFEDGADPSDSSVINAIVTFVSCLIAFQNIVPVSLYISIEIVKTIQAFFISQDLDMYYRPFDAACAPKTWNISDDLGQIEYIFSDKTGTLTQNIMEFQKCSVAGISYGEGVTEAQRGAAKRTGKEDILEPEEQERQLKIMKADMLSTMSRTFKNRYAQTEKLTFISPQLANELADKSSEQRNHLIAFFRALAICHSVLSDRPEPKAEPFRLEYKAESPDEAALVAAARDVGFPFVHKTKEGIDIEVMGQAEHYTHLEMIEFNSTRKRMSVIVRSPQGKLILYCKGADSVIYERLRPDHDPVLKEKTSKDMEAFANGGLRTLCIAYRYLEEEEYMNWQRLYDAATSSIKDRDEEMDKAAEQIEHSLTILGATALEDKLQEGVPDAIETLHQAGIKLWILTGDKVQTAIEIGFSCNLLKSDMEIMILSADSLQSAQLQIEGGLNKIASVLGPPSLDPQKRGFVPGAQKAFAVVIDGDTLRHALTEQLKTLFLNLATQCETVVCCRVSPAQKALVVKLVKDGRNAMTLSIGDGANDVAMIQEANIGCGLLGYEGSQAAMSADYAFGQFRFLTKLLLVHGRWSYTRVADMHSNFFYKNVIWTMGMFWFLIFNSFDATYLYQYTFVLLYNVVFTSLPVITLGAFDQDIHAKAALAFPQLYIRGIRGLEYTRLKFWTYMLDGLYQSAVIFFIPFAVWTVGSSTSWNGNTIDSLADFGTTVSVAAILAANTYVGINTRYWTVMAWVAIIGSTLIMLIWIVIYSFFDSPDFYQEVVILFGNVVFWSTVLLSALIALAPRFISKYIRASYFPLDKDIIREQWVNGDLKDRLGIKHRRDAKRERGRLEAAPMFHNPHARSESESSAFHHDIELGTSPPPRSRSVPPSSPARSTSSNNSLTPLPVSDRPSPLSSPSPQNDYREDLLNPNVRLQNAASPMSYYSASAIPAPSPYPGAQPNMSSISPYPVSSTNTLQVPQPQGRGHPPPQPQPQEAYEMHVRSTTQSTHHDRDATDASYATAYDGLMPDEGGHTYPHDSRQSWQGSTYSYSSGEPHAI